MYQITAADEGGSYADRCLAGGGPCCRTSDHLIHLPYSMIHMGSWDPIPVGIGFKRRKQTWGCGTPFFGGMRTVRQSIYPEFYYYCCRLRSRSVLSYPGVTHPLGGATRVFGWPYVITVVDLSEGLTKLWSRQVSIKRFVCIDCWVYVR